jgi:vacuolar protein sorting-associated protein 11
MKYATVFLENCAEDATQLFIDYYTGNFRPKKDAVVIISAPNNAQTGFGGRAASAVQNLAALLPLPYMNASASEPPAQNKENANIMTVVETNTDEPPAKYELPKPRTAFSAFVDHPQELITFLEACIKKDDWKEEDEADLYTTLFEMYVQTANTKKDEERTTWENKAKALIESKKVSS